MTKTKVRSNAVKALVLALVMMLATVSIPVMNRSYARAEASQTSSTAPSKAEEKPSTGRQIRKILIVAVCVGLLAAAYGVAEMLIRRKKMNEMLTKVRLEKGVLDPPAAKEEAETLEDDIENIKVKKPSLDDLNEPQIKNIK